MYQLTRTALCLGMSGTPAAHQIKERVMSFITRSTPMHYGERMKHADRSGAYTVGFYMSALVVVASFGPQMMNAAAPVRRAVAHAADSAFSSVPLDAAFAAIVSVIVVVIGLAIRELRATEDKVVFDVR